MTIISEILQYLYINNSLNKSDYFILWNKWNNETNIEPRTPFSTIISNLQGIWSKTTSHFRTTSIYGSIIIPEKGQSKTIFKCL